MKFQKKQLLAAQLEAAADHTLKKDRKMTLGEYIELAYKLQNEHPAWRWGQTLFNTLHKVNPDLANAIRTTELDTYYCAPDSTTEHLFWVWLAAQDEI